MNVHRISMMRDIFVVPYSPAARLDLIMLFDAIADAATYSAISIVILNISASVYSLVYTHLLNM
jgi:hypothetical protein